MLYDEALLADLPNDDCAVAVLCRKPEDTYASTAAPIIERWFRDFGRSGSQLRKRLCSPDDSTFWAAWWELAFARFFEEQVQEVELEPAIAGLTPDLRLRLLDGEEVLCEVFALNPSARTSSEDDRLRELSSALTRALSPDRRGFVSVSLLDELTNKPSDEDVDALATELGRWLDEGGDELIEVEAGNVRLVASLFETDDDVRVEVGPAARPIGDRVRIQDRIETKLGRYAVLERTDSPLVLAVGLSHWTHGWHGVVTSLYGDEQVVLEKESGEVLRVQYGGDGALVAGGPSGHPATAICAGVLILRRVTFDENAPGWVVEATFHHNPYGARRLSEGWVEGVREQVIEGDGLTWRGPPRTVVLS